MFGKSRSQRFSEYGAGNTSSALGPGCYDVESAEMAIKSKAYQNLPQSKTERFMNGFGNENLGPGAYNVMLAQAENNHNNVNGPATKIPKSKHHGRALQPRKSIAGGATGIPLAPAPEAAESETDRLRKRLRAVYSEKDSLQQQTVELKKKIKALKSELRDNVIKSRQSKGFFKTAAVAAQKNIARLEHRSGELEMVERELEIANETIMRLENALRCSKIKMKRVVETNRALQEKMASMEDIVDLYDDQQYVIQRLTEEVEETKQASACELVDLTHELSVWKTYARQQELELEQVTTQSQLNSEIYLEQTRDLATINAQLESMVLAQETQMEAMESRQREECLLLEQRLKESTNSLAQSLNYSEQMEKELHLMKEKELQSQRRIQELEARLEESLQEGRQSENKLKELSNELEQKLEEISALRQENAQVRAKLEQNTDMFAHEKSQLEISLRISMEAFESERKELIEQLEQQRLAHESELSRLKVQVADSEMALAKASEEIKISANQCMTLRKENQDLLQQLLGTSQLEKQLDEKKVEISNVSEKVIELENVVSSKDEEITRLAHVVADIKAQTLAKDDAVKNLENQLKVYKIKLIEHDILVHDDSKDVELALTKAAERRAKEELERLIEENGTLAGHQNHKQKIHYLKKVKEENANLKMTISQLEALVKRQEKQISNMKQQIKTQLQK